MSNMNILMDGDKSVCAFFKKKKYTLTIIASNGIVSGAGTYNAGTQVNIQATANAGYRFDSWSGDLSGSVNPTIILMNKNKTVTANFILIPVIQYTLATSVDPVDGGTITGAGTYPTGTNVTVEATPAIDYDFDHWSSDVVGKWSGLGMHIFSTSDNLEVLSPHFSGWVDELLANGFTQLRINVCYWNNPISIAIDKSAITIAVSKGAQVIWGVGGAPATITSTNWPSFRQGILDAAKWSQDNGVYEFQIGNEEERHVDGTTITGAQMITNLKAVATEVQAIFTRGNVSYSYGWQYDANWIAVGRGDVDIISANLYMGGEGNYTYPWKAELDRLIAAFGVDHTYLTEFSLSYSAIENYSTDEAVQATAVTEMIEYIKSKGVRGIFFCYYDDSRPFGPAGFGVKKVDGNYRLLWNSLLHSGGVIEEDEIEPPAGAIFPQDYATGTGTEDNPWTGGSYIDDAYHACPAGGTVYMRAGYYQLAVAVDVDVKTVNFIGEGRDKTIIKTADTFGFIITHDHCTFKHFTIDGAAQTSGDKPLINLAGQYGNCDYTICEDIEAKNGITTGIQPHTANHCLFKDIYAHHNREHGMHPCSNTVGQGKYNTYQNIYGWNNTKDAISGNGIGNGALPIEPTYNVYDNIQAWDNGRHGIAISYENEITLSNLVANGNGAKGFYISGVHDSKVENCSFTDNGTGGILISKDLDNVDFTNIIVKNNGTGIGIYNSSNLVFTSCQSYDDRATPLQSWGMEIQEGNSGISIINCKLSPNKLGDIHNPYGATVTITP